MIVMASNNIRTHQVLTIKDECPLKQRIRKAVCKSTAWCIDTTESYNV